MALRLLMSCLAFSSGEDLDPLETRIREACSAIRAGFTVARNPGMAKRTTQPDRPAAMESKARISRQAEEEHEDCPGELLPAGKPECTAAPPGQAGQDQRQHQGGQQGRQENIQKRGGSRLTVLRRSGLGSEEERKARQHHRRRY